MKVGIVNNKLRIMAIASLLTVTLGVRAPAQFTRSGATPTPTPTSAPKGMDEVEARVKTMQDAIKAAVTQFQRANGPTSEKMARLDKVLAVIDASLAEISENGPLYQEIGKAMKTSEALQAKYKDKATDPKIDAKIREKYQGLTNKLGTTINGLYERRMVLGDTRTDLEKRRGGLNQERDFIADLITADEMDIANQALLDVIDSVKGVVTSIDQFAENITATPAPEATGKETR